MLGAITNEDITLQSPAPKRGGWNIYGDCTFAARLPNILGRAVEEAAAMAKEAIERLYSLHD